MTTAADRSARAGLRVGIIGSGFGGIAVADELLRHGVTDVRLWERAHDLGGVWRDNRYPGAACDVPSPLYSFSFAPSRRWTRRYAGQAEILDYLRRVALDRGIAPLVRTGTEVLGAEWNGAAWRVRFAPSSDGSARPDELVDVLVSAVGQLSTPVVPELDGAASFLGPAFHAAQWPSDFDATGRRIAVIGSAATAVQLVPALTGIAARLDVHQRHANSLWPKPDGRYPRWYRPFAVAERGVFRALGELFSRGLDDRSVLGRAHRAITSWRLRSQVRDPRLRAQLTPDYTIGCKRILFSNDYYPALTRDDVQLLTDPIARITPTGVVTRDQAGAETEREVDAIVFATGFAAQQFLDGIEITGAGGAALHDTWRDGARAHLGITVPGFPNLAIAYGPNTNLGGSSIVLMLEAQARRIRTLATTLADGGHVAVEPTVAAEAAWDATVQGELEHSPWASCDNWYRHPATGRITSNWPGGTVAYRRRLRRFDPAEYSWI